METLPSARVRAPRLARRRPGRHAVVAPGNTDVARVTASGLSEKSLTSSLRRPASCSSASRRPPRAERPGLRVDPPPVRVLGRPAPGVRLDYSAVSLQHQVALDLHQDVQDAIVERAATWSRSRSVPAATGHDSRRGSADAACPLREPTRRGPGSAPAPSPVIQGARHLHLDTRSTGFGARGSVRRREVPDAASGLKLRRLPRSNTARARVAALGAASRGPIWVIPRAISVAGRQSDGDLRRARARPHAMERGSGGSSGAARSLRRARGNRRGALAAEVQKFRAFDARGSHDRGKVVEVIFATAMRARVSARHHRGC